jgi:probable rRNA maturation factor
MRPLESVMASSRSFRLPPFHFRIDTDVRCSFPLYLRRELRNAAEAALRGMPRSVLRSKLRSGVSYPLTISVVSPSAIRKLNRQYRGKDRPTDVLSFSRLEGPLMPLPEIGDILVCWEMAKRQTGEFQTTRPSEIRRLVVHGVLHLFDYDHERGPAEAKRMFRLQEKILRTLTLGSPR